MSQWFGCVPDPFNSNSVAAITFLRGRFGDSADDRPVYEVSLKRLPIFSERKVKGLKYFSGSLPHWVLV